MLLTVSDLFPIFATEIKKLLMLLTVSDLFPIFATQTKEEMNVIYSVWSLSYHCNTNCAKADIPLHDAVVFIRN